MKIPFVPERSSYSVSEGPYRGVDLSIVSPDAYVGKGMPWTAYTVNASYNLVADEVTTFMTFYRDHIDGLVFDADLIIVGPELKEYDCKFVQQSLKISNAGLAYYVSVQLVALEKR